MGSSGMWTMVPMESIQHESEHSRLSSGAGFTEGAANSCQQVRRAFPHSNAEGESLPFSSRAIGIIGTSKTTTFTSDHSEHSSSNNGHVRFQVEGTKRQTHETQDLHTDHFQEPVQTMKRSQLQQRPRTPGNTRGH